MTKEELGNIRECVEVQGMTGGKLADRLLDEIERLQAEVKTLTERLAMYQGER